MQATEANFDGLVGPTHNYAGLSFGNVASQNNEKSVANPKAAAKQGLRKMKQLADLGFNQGVLPPQERPSLRLLRELGFSGDEASVIERVAKSVAGFVGEEGIRVAVVRVRLPALACRAARECR